MIWSLRTVSVSVLMICCGSAPVIAHDTPALPVGSVVAPVVASPIPPPTAHESSQSPTESLTAAQPPGPTPLDASAEPGAGYHQSQQSSPAVLAPTVRTSIRYFMDPWARSGCPQVVRRFAIPSTLPNQYSGGYVGGGVPLFGEPRYANDGTWAIDYHGLIHKRVWLGWTHGRRYQGGTEGYETDGPHLLPHH